MINHKSNRAFSMIELFVVIAIIFMLAGLSVGAYQKVRSEALKAQCMSNLKTISYSMSMYLSDHDGVMLPCKNISGDKWTTILVENGYLHEGTYFEPAGATKGSAREVGQEPLFCPEDNSDNNILFSVKYACGGSYAMNRDISSSETVNRKWSHIQNADKKVLLCDYNELGIQDEKNYLVSGEVNSNNWQNGGSDGNGTVGKAHFGGANCLYADWHVSFKNQKEFKTEDFTLELNFH